MTALAQHQLLLAAVALAVNQHIIMNVKRGKCPAFFMSFQNKMPTKYYSVEEANTILETIKPFVARLVEKRAKVSRQSLDLGPLLTDLRSNVGSATTSEMTQDFAEIEQLITKIEASGCVLKDINSGLLDFLSLHDGREVYLCWRYGEDKIEFYHELHTGFNGRRSL